MSQEGPKRLNVGCGHDVLPGWINLDVAPLPGVDIVFDLDDCRTERVPLEDDCVDEILMKHVLEHLNDVLGAMEELHRLAKPGARLTIVCPHGASDDAWEDPTHKRALFPRSFGYFSQPYYWRADYGYRGDWQPEKITLRMDRREFEGKSREDIIRTVNRCRNVVLDMVVELRAVKPIRRPRKELQVEPAIEIQFVDI